jgi:hypothetical protein
MIDLNEDEMAASMAFDRIGKITLSNPIDVLNKDERNGALIACCTDLVAALDNGRITFSSNYDELIFHGLLAIAGDIVMEGRLKEVFGKVTLN